MEQWDNYVDLGYGIPRYAVMETLRAMRDKAEPDTTKGYDKKVSCSNEMKVANKRGFDLSVLANCRCVGLSISCMELTDITDSTFEIHFDLKEH